MVGVCSVSPPCLYPSGTVESKLLLANSPLWAWESKLLVFPEHHCVMGLCPWELRAQFLCRVGGPMKLRSLSPWYFETPPIPGLKSQTALPPGSPH